jgi:hypothetical protein
MLPIALLAIGFARWIRRPGGQPCLREVFSAATAPRLGERQVYATEPRIGQLVDDLRQIHERFHEQVGSIHTSRPRAMRRSLAAPALQA